jgi:hypothetical protein
MLYYHLHKTFETSAKARIFDFLTPTATPAGPIPPTGRRAVGTWQAWQGWQGPCKDTSLTWQQG